MQFTTSGGGSDEALPAIAAATAVATGDVQKKISLLSNNSAIAGELFPHYVSEHAQPSMPRSGSGLVVLASLVSKIPNQGGTWEFFGGNTNNKGRRKKQYILSSAFVICTASKEFSRCQGWFGCSWKCFAVQWHRQATIFAQKCGTLAVFVFILLFSFYVWNSSKHGWGILCMLADMIASVRRPDVCIQDWGGRTYMHGGAQLSRMCCSACFLLMLHIAWWRQDVSTMTKKNS